MLLTVAAGAATVPTPVHDGTRLHGVQFAVLALLVAPLRPRKIWPVPVFGWMLATAIAAGLRNRNPGGPALLIAL